MICAVGRDAEYEESQQMYGCNAYMSKTERDLFHTQVINSNLPTTFSHKMYFWPISHDQLRRNLRLTQNLDGHIMINLIKWKNMKNYIVYFILLLTLVLTGACNNEWVEEVYVQNVGLKAPVNSKGVTDVYLRYQANGEVTYRLPVIVGGSTMNERDLDVAIDVDPDTLIGLNEARWKQREDLYFQLLDKKHYEFASPTCHIPAGECQGLFDIKFKFSGLDLVDKWVLPLTILDSDSYDPNPRKNYRKALLRVMPFNDYSGAYGATNMFVYMMVIRVLWFQVHVPCM